jgi:hypothetical protein
MKRKIVVGLILITLILTSCGSKKTASKTSNSSSKTVDQVLQEKTGESQTADDKNHGGNVTNPDDQSNQKSIPKPVISGGASQINGGSNMKKPSSNTGKVTQASDIDIDLTRLSSTMVYSEVYNMMNSPESYVGKMVRMNGKLAVYKYPERNYYTCIIKDATACCQQGMEFLWAGNHKYPDDYPNEGDGIIVTGTFDIYYEGENKYVQLKDASLIKSKT